MVTIQCETAHFKGRGTFTCRQCWMVTPLPEGLSAVLLSLPTSRVVFDAETGAVIHECDASKRVVTIPLDSVVRADITIIPGSYSLLSP